MRVTKKLKSDLEIIDSLQRLTGYKLTRNTKEKSPRMIFLQKITNNDMNAPIKVQLLKSKNLNQTQSNFLNINTNNMNLSSYSSNKEKISFSKKEKNNFQTNQRYKNSSINLNNIKNQSPIKKSSNVNIYLNPKANNRQMLNVLSKNYLYNKKKPNGQLLSPNLGTNSIFQPSRKNTSDTNNSNINTKNFNTNNDFSVKTYVGRDNYSVNSFKNFNKININSSNSPKTPSYITDIDSSNNPKSVKNNNEFSNNNYIIDIKLEDLILFEERLNDIIIAINQGNVNMNNINIINNNINNNKYDIGASNECYEFFAFYFHSSLKYKFPLFFHEENKLVIQSAINLKLFIIMITYHLSLNQNLFLKMVEELKFIFSLLKQNLYLFIKKLIIFYGEAFIIQNEMYFKNFNHILSRSGLNNLNENDIKELIYQNCSSIAKNITNILNHYKILENPYYFDFYEMFSILSQITEKEINNYFCTYLYGAKQPKNIFSKNKSDNLNIIPHKINLNYNFINTIKTDVELFEYKKNRFRPPYITTPSQKKYTLVLDLNNTLINYNNNNKDENTTSTYTLRPGLLSFLNTLKPIYELISFTNESKEISDKYLQEIEMNKKYFDFNLYKEHNILIGRNLVKDISKIGRDMKRIIIVDKLYENIKATPQNGILIKPYFGEKYKNDTILFELKKLLILFHKMGYEDIRVAIKNYANDIKYKISCDNYCINK